jgi:hypothetical protein
MHASGIRALCMCVPSMDGATKRARRTRARAAHSRIVSARTRSHAYARTHSRVPIHIPGLFLDAYIYIYIYSYMTCALAIYTGGRTYPRMRTCDGDGRIVGARNRTHVCIAGGAAACTPIPISHTSAHIPTHICIMHTYRYIYMYIRMNTYIHKNKPCLLRAAIPNHVHAQACTFPHVYAHTHERTSAVPPRTTARAATTCRRARPARSGAAPGPERRRIPGTCSIQTRCSTRRCSR